MEVNVKSSFTSVAVTFLSIKNYSFPPNHFVWTLTILKIEISIVEVLIVVVVVLILKTVKVVL